MNIRHNNLSYAVEGLSDVKKEELARALAFERDTAIGNLALLGLPDYEYVADESFAVEEPSATPVIPIRGYRLEH